MRVEARLIVVRRRLQRLLILPSCEHFDDEKIELSDRPLQELEDALASAGAGLLRCGSHAVNEPDPGGLTLLHRCCHSLPTALALTMSSDGVSLI